MVDLKNAGAYIESFLKIRTKEGEVVPFVLNAPQRKLYSVIKAEHQAGKPVRIIILKARQMGFSTMTEALIFQDTATTENVNSMIVAHREDATANLFRMSKLFYEELPEPVKPMLKASNAQELYFANPSRDPEDKRPGLRSRIRCVTAGGKGIGRSDTLRNVHASEYAFWTGDKEGTMLGLLQAVPALPGTMVIIESTANGFDDFKKRWDAAVRGESDFVPVFFAWWENPEYQMPVPPGTVFSEKEREIQRTYQLTEQQLQWRRWCIQNNCGGDESLFKQEYPAAPEEAFLTSGRPVFDNEEIILRREAAGEPLQRGDFAFDYDGLAITNIRFVEGGGGNPPAADGGTPLYTRGAKSEGYVAVYKAPEQGVPYVIGGDTAGEGSDWFTAHVLDNRTGEQVAVLRHQFGEEEYARQVYCLGMWYNQALIALETNYSTYPTRELERLNYPNLYVRETEDSYTHKLRKSHGFVTNSLTRPLIIAGLQTVMRERPQLVVDRDTLGEMLTFVYNEQRRPEAMAGEHDDLVMALAIAYQVRDQQRYTVELPEPEPEETELRDYDEIMTGGDVPEGYLF